MPVYTRPIRPEELYHWESSPRKNHKYIAKVGEGDNTRYFYSRAEYAAYQTGRTVSNAANSLTGYRYLAKANSDAKKRDQFKKVSTQEYDTSNQIAKEAKDERQIRSEAIARNKKHKKKGFTDTAKQNESDANEKLNVARNLRYQAETNLENSKFFEKQRKKSIKDFYSKSALGVTLTKLSKAKDFVSSKIKELTTGHSEKDYLADDNKKKNSVSSKTVAANHKANTSTAPSTLDKSSVSKVDSEPTRTSKARTSSVKTVNDYSLFRTTSNVNKKAYNTDYTRKLTKKKSK